MQLRKVLTPMSYPYCWQNGDHGITFFSKFLKTKATSWLLSRGKQLALLPPGLCQNRQLPQTLSHTLYEAPDLRRVLGKCRQRRRHQYIVEKVHVIPKEP